MTNVLITSALVASLLFSQPRDVVLVAGQTGQLVTEAVLASETMDLSYRYPEPSVSEGFKTNILIAVSYLMKNGSIVLKPGEVFAFHRNLLPEFEKEKIITQESGFGIKDGYLYVAGLPGNGVCHLASLMNQVASEANLAVTAEVNHNFAQIPGIDKKYGTSIYFLPGGGSSTERQNLYIKNNKKFPVEFKFVLEGELLSFKIVEVK